MDGRRFFHARLPSRHRDLGSVPAPPRGAPHAAGRIEGTGRRVKQEGQTAKGRLITSQPIVINQQNKHTTYDSVDEYKNNLYYRQIDLSQNDLHGGKNRTSTMNQQRWKDRQ